MVNRPKLAWDNTDNHATTPWVRWIIEQKTLLTENIPQGTRKITLSVKVFVQRVSTDFEYSATMHTEEPGQPIRTTANFFGRRGVHTRGEAQIVVRDRVSGCDRIRIALLKTQQDIDIARDIWVIFFDI